MGAIYIAFDLDDLGRMAAYHPLNEKEIKEIQNDSIAILAELFAEISVTLHEALELGLLDNGPKSAEFFATLKEMFEKTRFGRMQNSENN